MDLARGTPKQNKINIYIYKAGPRRGGWLVPQNPKQHQYQKMVVAAQMMLMSDSNHFKCPPVCWE
jgi:hypothetical protein